MIESFQQRCITVFAVMVVALMCAISLQVAFSAMDINPILEFGSDHFWLGNAITLNSLLDFQWHLLVVIGLLPASIVWLTDQHVRVDFLYQGHAAKTKARINLLGNLVFAAPFLFLALPASWDFMRRAWRSGEGSRNGGINDLWLIKAALPIGLTLLVLAILIETVRLFRAAR